MSFFLAEQYSPAACLMLVGHGLRIRTATNTCFLSSFLTYSNPSAQSMLLGARYNLPVRTLDELLFEGADVEAPAGLDLDALLVRYGGAGVLEGALREWLGF